MSKAMEVTVTKNLYIDKWSVRKFNTGGDLAADDITVLDTDKGSNDYMFHLCAVDLTITVPDAQAAQLAELAGCENALAQERERSMARMASLAARIEELKALPAPEAHA